MSHHFVETAFVPLHIAVLTVSDSRGEDQDTSGQYLKAAAAAAGQLSGAAGQRFHHRAAVLGRHRAPAGDLVAGALAADAEARLGVDDADLDAGAVDFRPLPDAVGVFGSCHALVLG